MASYPNQRTVIMPNKGERIRDKQNKYGMFNIEAAKAVGKLGYSTFMLYMIIEKNQDEYVYELSPKALESEWGLKVDAYRSAFKKLVDNGYLTPKSENSHSYYFHEFPIVGKSIEEKNSNNSHIGKIQTSANGKSIEETKIICGKTVDTYTENPQRNNTDNTIINNTKNNTSTANQRFAVSAACGGEKNWIIEKRELEEKLETINKEFEAEMNEKIKELGAKKWYEYKKTQEYKEKWDEYSLKTHKIREKLEKYKIYNR